MSWERTRVTGDEWQRVYVVGPGDRFWGNALSFFPLDGFVWFTNAVAAALRVQRFQAVFVVGHLDGRIWVTDERYRLGERTSRTEAKSQAAAFLERSVRQADSPN